MIAHAHIVNTYNIPNHTKIHKDKDAKIKTREIKVRRLSIGLGLCLVCLICTHSYQFPSVIPGVGVKADRSRGVNHSGQSPSGFYFDNL